MSDDDNDGQMIYEELVGLKLPDICLTGEEKTRKTSPRKLVPTGDRTRARCVTGAHATACLIAVNEINWCIVQVNISVCYQKQNKLYVSLLIELYAGSHENM